MEKKLCLLLLVVNIHLRSSVSHSLRFFHTAVISGEKHTDFSIVGLMDGDQNIYDDIKKKIPNTNTETQTQTTQDHQKKFRRDMTFLIKHFNQTGERHTLQMMYGCELYDDGTKTGYSQYGYNGEDLLILDLNTLTWTAANAKAVIMKQRWENETWAIQVKNYLMYECIDWLQKYVDYGRSTLERKVRPEVSLFQKDSSSPVVCHATGFYPKSVMIYWQKNGEDLHEDVEIRETLPNQDGTFQKRSILTVSPEELTKHSYTCIVQHSSLEKKMVRSFKPDGVSVGVIVGVVVAVLFLLVVIVGVEVFIWKRKQSGVSLESPGKTSKKE